MLVPQTTTVSPNALYARSILLGMSIVDGKPVGQIMSVQLQGALVSNLGVWSNAGNSATIGGISFGFDANDIPVLPTKYAALNTEVGALWGDIVDIIAAINAIDKVL